MPRALAVLFIPVFPLLIALGNLLGGQLTRFAAVRAFVDAAVYRLPVVLLVPCAAHAAQLLTRGKLHPVVRAVAELTATAARAMMPIVCYGFRFLAAGTNMLACTLLRLPAVPENST